MRLLLFLQVLRAVGEQYPPWSIQQFYKSSYHPENGLTGNDLEIEEPAEQRL